MLGLQLAVVDGVMHFPSSCVGVPVPAVAIANQLGFLAGIRRLVDYRSLDVCRKNRKSTKVSEGSRSRRLWWSKELAQTRTSLFTFHLGSFFSSKSHQWRVVGI